MGNIDALRVLLETMPDEQVRCVDDGGSTALLRAVFHGFTDCVQLLLDSQADVVQARACSFLLLLLLLCVGAGACFAHHARQAHRNDSGQTALGVTLLDKTKNSGASARLLLAAKADPHDYEPLRKPTATKIFLKLSLFLQHWSVPVCANQTLSPRC